jgi:hypothetical protein
MTLELIIFAEQTQYLIKLHPRVTISWQERSKAALIRAE